MAIIVSCPQEVKLFMLGALFCGCRAGHLEQRESGLINNHTYPIRSLSLSFRSSCLPALISALFLSLSFSFSLFSLPFPHSTSPLSFLLCFSTSLSLFFFLSFFFFFLPFSLFPLRLICNNEFERKLNQSLFVMSEHRFSIMTTMAMITQR